MIRKALGKNDDNSLLSNEEANLLDDNSESDVIKFVVRLRGN